jgi:thymidylate synthase
MTFNVSGNKLNAILNQRSQDMLAANNWNVVQYSILLHIMARVSGLEVGELVHVIADAHIYDRHVPIIEELIKNESFDSPRLEIDKSITDFYDFKVENFKLVDYKFNPMKIKVPIAV